MHQSILRYLDAARYGRRLHNLRRIIDLPGHPDSTESLRPNTLLMSTEGWIELLVRLYREHGMDSFVFWPSGVKQLEQVKIFAGEAVPATRHELRVME